MQTHLDGLGCLQRLLRGDAHLPLPQELLGEVGDVPSCDGDVLYTAANHVTLSLSVTEERTEDETLFGRLVVVLLNTGLGCEAVTVGLDSHDNHYYLLLI